MVWTRSGRLPGAMLALLFAAASSVSALSNAYCSTQNTGGSLAQSSIYMSMGRCFDQCKASYAFAVVQGDSCWCSNYIPASQVSTSSCNTPCPGYPSDLCGNQAEGLYGYVALSNAPSGTAAASTGSSPTSDSSSLTTDPPASTSKTAPITSVVVITQNGGQITQTVTSTPTAGTGAVLGGAKKGSGASGGIIAAAVIASLFGLAVIGALIFFLWRRKRRADEDEKFGGLRDEDAQPSDLNRNASTHSKSGLLSRTYPAAGASRINTSNTRPDMSSSDNHSPISPTSERRNSRPLMYDQRLNPIMVMDNGSHTSLRTLDDGRDYGRILKIANPDEGRTSTSAH